MVPGSDRAVQPGLRRWTCILSFQPTQRPVSPEGGLTANAHREVRLPPDRLADPHGVLAVPASQTTRWHFRNQHAISQLTGGRAGLSGVSGSSVPLVLPDTSLPCLPLEGRDGASL